MFGVRAVDAEHVSIANAPPGLQMKSGYETAADKSDSKFVRQRTTLPSREVNTSEFQFLKVFQARRHLGHNRWGLIFEEIPFNACLLCGPQHILHINNSCTKRHAIGNI